MWLHCKYFSDVDCSCKHCWKHWRWTLCLSLLQGRAQHVDEGLSILACFPRQLTIAPPEPFCGSGWHRGSCDGDAPGVGAHRDGRAKCTGGLVNKSLGNYNLSILSDYHWNLLLHHDSDPGRTYRKGPIEMEIVDIFCSNRHCPNSFSPPHPTETGNLWHFLFCKFARTTISTQMDAMTSAQRWMCQPNNNGKCWKKRIYFQSLPQEFHSQAGLA